MSLEPSNLSVVAGYYDIPSQSKRVKLEQADVEQQLDFSATSDPASTNVVTHEDHARTLASSLSYLCYLLSEIPRRLDPLGEDIRYWLSRKLFSTWMRSKSHVILGSWIRPELRNDTLSDLLPSFNIQWDHGVPSTSSKLTADRADLFQLFNEAEKARGHFWNAYTSLKEPGIGYTIFNDRLSGSVSLTELLRGQYEQPTIGLRTDTHLALPSSLGNIAEVGKFVCQAIYRDEIEARKEQEEYEAASLESKRCFEKADELKSLLDSMDVMGQYRDRVVSQVKLELEGLVLDQKKCSLRVVEVARIALAGEEGQFRTFEQYFGNIDTWTHVG